MSSLDHLSPCMTYYLSFSATQISPMLFSVLATYLLYHYTQYGIMLNFITRKMFAVGGKGHQPHIYVYSYPQRKVILLTLTLFFSSIIKIKRYIEVKNNSVSGRTCHYFPSNHLIYAFLCTTYDIILFEKICSN